MLTVKNNKYSETKNAAEGRINWHGMLVNLAHETTLRWGKENNKIGNDQEK